MKRLRRWVSGREDHLLLAAVLVFALFRGLVWVGAYPALKIVDEASHFDDLQYRAENRLAAPIPDGSKLGASAELSLAWSTTQHYWRDRFVRGRRVAPEEKELDELAKTDASRQTHGQSSSIDQPGVYYTLGVVPYSMFRHASILSRIFAVRVYSLCWGLLLVACTFICLRWCIDSRPLAVAGAMFAALQPIAAQQTIAINDDAGVVGLCALVFSFQLAWIRRLPLGPRWPLTVACGAVLALALQTKPYAWGLLPGMVLLVVLSLRRATRSRDTYVALGALVASTLVIYVVAGLLGGTSRPPGSLAALLDLPGWLLSLDDAFVDYLVSSGWGSFCLQDVGLEPGWFDVLSHGATLLWIGMGIAIARRVISPAASYVWRLGPSAFATFTAITGSIFLLFLELSARQTTGHDHAIPGRAFLFVLPAFTIVGVVALSALVPRRFHGLIAALFATGALLLALGALVTVVRYEYVG